MSDMIARCHIKSLYSVPIMVASNSGLQSRLTIRTDIVEDE